MVSDRSACVGVPAIMVISVRSTSRGRADAEPGRTAGLVDIRGRGRGWPRRAPWRRAATRPHLAFGLLARGLQRLHVVGEVVQRRLPVRAGVLQPLRGLQQGLGDESARARLGGRGRPRRGRPAPAPSDAWRWPASSSSNGSASSATVAWPPAASRARIARRVGSARAAKAWRLRRSVDMACNITKAVWNVLVFNRGDECRQAVTDARPGPGWPGQAGAGTGLSSPPQPPARPRG